MLRPHALRFRSFRAGSTSSLAFAGILVGVLAACGGGDGSGAPAPTPPPPPPPPAPVASVEFTGTAPGPLVVGSTVQLQARTLAANGTLLTGRSITWASSASAVATVSGTGLVTGVAPGTATITATSEGRSAAVEVTVIPPPVATVVVSPAFVTLETGETATLQATLRDAQGNVLTGREVTWASGATAVATVDEDGVVTGVAPGEAAVTATSEGQSGVSSVTVVSGTAPRIDAIEPSVLLEGETATITGARFAATPAGNAVRLGGRVVEVLQASETQLTIRVPSGGCFPEGMEPVEVRVGSEEASEMHPFRPAGLLDLPAGELHVIRAPAELCLQIPQGSGGGEYIVGVQSTSETPDLKTPVRVAARVSGMPEVPFAGGAPFRSFAATGGSAVPPEDDYWAEHQGLHLAFMEEQEEAMAAFRARGMPTAAMGETAAMIPATAAVGDTFQLSIAFTGSCAATPQHPMVVRVKSERSFIVTDPGPDGDGYTQAELDAKGAFIDQFIYARHEEFLGSFTDVDGNGRVVVVISPRINEIGGVLGFARGVDFFDPATCPQSNGGEFLYVIAPDPAAASNAAAFKANALADFPRLAAHEIAHVVQVGRRQTTSKPGMPTWVTEGQAVLTEEYTAMATLGLQQGQNYGRSVANVAHGATGTFWFRTRFQDMLFYYGYTSATERKEGAPEGCGWLSSDRIHAGTSGICNYGRIPYGPAWSFHRYVADHYAHRVGGEAELNRAVVELQTVSLATVANLVGENYRDLLAGWAATLWTDGRGSGYEPLLTFPSWNLRDIENSYVATGHLTPYAHDFTPFQRDLTIASGSSAYLRIAGSEQRGTALRVTTQFDTPTSPHVQLWVVRAP
jgi:hypothetical protein